MSERTRSPSRRPARPWARRSGRHCASSSRSCRASIASRCSSRSSPRAERGLLGVGFTPAHVIASASGETAVSSSSPDDAPRRSREIVERIAAGIGGRRLDLRARARRRRDGDLLRAPTSRSSSASTARRSTRSSTWRTRSRARRAASTRSSSTRPAIGPGGPRRSRGSPAGPRSASRNRPPLGARADDAGRAQDRPRGAEGGPGGRDRERGLRAQPLRRRLPAAHRGLSDAANPRALARGADLATPGMTGLDGSPSARRVLLDDALRAVPSARGLPGWVVDVGSGGGSPGIPLAVSLPDRAVHPARGRAPEVRLPGARHRAARERQRRLGTRRGAADGRVRRRAREGARQAAGRRRAVPSHSSRRTASRSSGSARPAISTPSRPSRSCSARDWRATAAGWWCSASSAPDTDGVPARPGMAKKRPSPRAAGAARCGGGSR